MTAIILAGGKNSLISEKFPDLPPPLIPVAQEPFLHWLSLWVKAQGFHHIVLSAGHAPDKIIAWANQASELDPSLCLDIMTEPRPLGTGGAAALSAKRFPADVFLVTNGDSLLLVDLKPAIAKLRATPGLDGILVGAPLANAGRFGALEVDAEQKLMAFREKEPGSTLINTGIYLLKQELLDTLMPEKACSLEYECFPTWLEQGKTFEVISSPQPFLDVGTLDAIAKSEKFMAKKEDEFLATFLGEPFEVEE